VTNVYKISSISAAISQTRIQIIESVQLHIRKNKSLCEAFMLKEKDDTNAKGAFT